MEVLLIILKVLGITLLILLGMILLLLFLVLLVPVFYTIDAEYFGDLKAVGRARWLCFVLDFKGTYGNSKFLYYLKSFGFTISTNDETDKHFYKGLEEEEEPEELVPVQLIEDDYETFLKEREVHYGAETPIEPRPPGKEQEKPKVREEEAGQQTPRELKEETGQQKELMQPEETVEVQPRRTGILLRIHDKVRAGFEWVTTIPMRIHYKISEILSRILDFLANIKENMERQVEKKDEILNQLNEVKSLIKGEPFKRAFRDVKKYLLKLLKHVRPRKFQGTIRFGLADPASTGQVLGVVGMLIPLYRDHLVVAPDFEQKIFEGQLHAKGRMQVGFFLTLVARIIMNRNLMNTIRQARTIIGGND